MFEWAKVYYFIFITKDIRTIENFKYFYFYRKYFLLSQNLDDLICIISVSSATYLKKYILRQD